MATPYLVSGKVYDTDGTTVMPNVRVTLRNESTNNNLTQDTNSAGEYVFNLADLSQGWTRGDTVTVAVLYKNFEAYSSHTTPTTGGGTTINLTLSAISTTQLRYCSVQDVYNYFNLISYETDTENGVKAQQINTIGLGAEAEIDTKCNTKFDNNSGSYYSNTEYLDTNNALQTYHLSKTPISSVTTLATTQDDEETDPSYASDWKSLTQNTDYTLDTETGRVIVVNSSYIPISRKRGLYAVYKYGYSSVPKDIQKLVVLMIGRELGKMSVGKALISGRGEFTPTNFNAFDEEIKSILTRYKRWQIGNTVINNP